MGPALSQYDWRRPPLVPRFARDTRTLQGKHTPLAHLQVAPWHTGEIEEGAETLGANRGRDAES